MAGIMAGSIFYVKALSAIVEEKIPAKTLPAAQTYANKFMLKIFKDTF